MEFSTPAGKKSRISVIVEFEPRTDILKLRTTEKFDKLLGQGKIEGGSLKLVGYDQSKGELFTNENCKLEKKIGTTGGLAHSCDTIPGMSGSPILQNRKVVAIHLGYLEKLDRNAGFELSRASDKSATVEGLGVKNEWGVHVRPPEVHVRNVVPVDVRNLADLILPPGAVEVEGGIQIPGIPGLIQRKPYDPDTEQVQQFAICMHVPGYEAASCLSMLMGCAPAAAAAGVGYGVCVAATCGASGAAHAWRCAKKQGSPPNVN